MANDLPAETAFTWTPEGKGADPNNLETNHGRRPEGCWVDLGHSGKESSRRRELARFSASLIIHLTPGHEEYK